MRRIAAVTFDAAGTLITPHPGVGLVYAEIAARYGLERDATELDIRFAPAFKAAVAAWPVPYGRDDDDARRFWSRVIDETFGEPLPFEIVCDLYDAFARAERWRILPGVREALALCTKLTVPMAVLSNFDLRLAPLLSELDLGPFSVVLTSAEVGAAKPDPALLIAACRRLGISPTHVVHVGDSEREDGGMCAATGARWLRADPQLGIPFHSLADMLVNPS